MVTLKLGQQWNAVKPILLQESQDTQKAKQELHLASIPLFKKRRKSFGVVRGMLVEMKLVYRERMKLRSTVLHNDAIWAHTGNPVLFLLSFVTLAATDKRMCDPRTPNFQGGEH